jgi:hypothetical protein
MKKLFTLALILSASAAFSQVSYIGYTYNYIMPISVDSLVVNLTTNYQVGQSVSTIECSFNVGKNKTWLQLEAIFEEKSQACYDNLIGN